MAQREARRVAPREEVDHRRVSRDYCSTYFFGLHAAAREELREERVQSAVIFRRDVSAVLLLAGAAYSRNHVLPAAFLAVEAGDGGELAPGREVVERGDDRRRAYVHGEAKPSFLSAEKAFM